MAYIKTPEELEKENQEQGQSLATGGESAFSSQAPAAGATAPATAGAPGGGGAPSNGFTNMDKYLAVNEGANQALTGQITDKASKTFDEAGKALDAAKTSASSAVAAGTTKADTALTSQIQNDASKLSANQLTQASKINAGFTGPNAFQDTQGYKAFSSLYDNAYQDANQYRDPNFRSAMLDDMFNSSENKAKVGGYTSGMRGFDSMLLNSQADTIGKAVDSAGSAVTGKRDSYQTEVNQAIADQKKAADEQKKLLANSVKAGQTNLVSANQTELAQKNAARDQQIAQAGKTMNVVDKGSAYSMGDVLSQQELAIARALESLGGGKTFADTSKTYKDFTTQERPVINKPTTTPTTGTVTNGTLMGIDNTVINAKLTPEQQKQMEAERIANEKKKAQDAAKPIINPGTIAINPNLIRYY